MSHDLGSANDAGVDSPVARVKRPASTGIARHILVAAGWTFLLVTVPLHGWEFQFVCLAWIGSLVTGLCRRDRLVGVPIRLAVSLTLYLLAVYAPTKPARWYLDTHRIALPTTTMTVAELAASRRNLIYFPDGSSSDGRQVVFPEADLTLREFVRAIESQTNLRSQQANCGTSASILFGSSFMGLMFTDPGPR